MPSATRKEISRTLSSGDAPGALKRMTSEERVPFVRTGPLEASDVLDPFHNTPAGYKKIADKTCEAILQSMPTHTAAD